MKINPGPCAKATVFCIIISEKGVSYLGQNWCANPQLVCPREPGEDYTKCKTICQQAGHAELDALKIAGANANQSTAEVHGHSYVCRECQEALYGAGVKSISVLKGGCS